MNAVLHAFAPFQDAAVALVAYFVTALWMGVAIAALTALLVRVWRPLDAATRYAVWYVALIAIVFGPLVTVVTMYHALSVNANAVFAGALAAGDAHVFVLSAADRHVQIALPPLVVLAVAAVWSCIAAAGSVRVIVGVLALAKLKRDALPLAPERRAALPLWQTRSAMRGARRARLCVSDRIEVPVAVGLFDGMVLIPDHVLDVFEPGDIDRFVLHELVHLERRDDWTTLFQRIAQAVLFFNPAVQLIAGRLDLEREIACDDGVVAATHDVRSYAVGLTRMAEATAWPHHALAAPAIFVTRRQLSLRVERLLIDRGPTARRVAFVPAAVALATSLGVVACAGSLAPAFAVAGPQVVGSSMQPAFMQKREILIIRRDGKTVTNESEVSKMFVLPSTGRGFPSGVFKHIRVVHPADPSKPGSDPDISIDVTPTGPLHR